MSRRYYRGTVIFKYASLRPLKKMRNITDICDELDFGSAIGSVVFTIKEKQTTQKTAAKFAKQNRAPGFFD